MTNICDNIINVIFIIVFVRYLSPLVCIIVVRFFFTVDYKMHVSVTYSACVRMSGHFTGFLGIICVLYFVLCLDYVLVY